MSNVIGSYFYAFDIEKGIIPVFWDNDSMIFYDPLDEITYDFPWVFKSKDDLIKYTPDLLSQQIQEMHQDLYNLTNLIYELASQRLALLNIKTYYFVDWTKLSIGMCDDKGRDLLSSYVVDLKFDTRDAAFEYMAASLAPKDES